MEGVVSASGEGISTAVESGEVGGDFLRDLLTSKEVKPQEFDSSSVSTRISSLPDINEQKGICRACSAPSYHGPYCKVHTNAYNSLYKLAVKNGEVESNPQFIRFINIFGTRKKGWARSGNPVVACSVLVAFIDKFPAGKAERGKLRGQMTLVQIAKDEGCRSEQLAREVLPVYDFEFFVNQSKLHRGWDFTKAKEMWDGFDTDDNFGDYDGPPYAKKRLMIPAWVFCTSSKENIQSNYKDARLTEHSKSVSGLFHVFL